MKDLKLLQDEIGKSVCSYLDCTASLLYPGYAQNPDAPAALARGYAVASLFTNCPIHIYENDKILGSIRGKFENSLGLTEESLKYRRELIENFGERSFLMNFDHFAPDYETFLKDGIAATLEKIRKSRFDFSNSPDSENEILFLDSLEIAMTGFQNMVRNYAQEAFSRAQGEKEPIRKVELEKMALVADSLTKRAPQSFREALQLMWFVHVAFVLEGRNAMAIGRMDQFLFPYYEADRIKGEISEDEALELLAFTLCKIGESRIKGGDDVVNIAIGGVRRDGSDAVNELSFLILEAVKICNIPGPNLSARISKETPDEFLDACLCVIGTGLGYPALMNDEVNIPALFRHGYSLEDCRDYCMVGCIENFLAGKQPPWSDGRYNTPKFLELALNNGICMLTGVQMGPKTGEPESFNSMEEFLKAFEEQMEYGAADYMMRFRNENDRLNRFSYSSPFLSCFCSSCIERGLDINNGGTIYPSVHGAGCMGIATVADSLAAIEKTVFVDKKISLGQLRKVLLADFEGYESVRILLKKAPKYGNNEDLVDRYAVWYVNIHDKIFSKYKTPDGGPIYIAIASNVSNIPAGALVAATPDGRSARKPLSEAASPSHGEDKNGPTAVVLSVTRPDYTKVSCGTVLNQKYSPEMFTKQEYRQQLCNLIRVYFDKGGQEIQINAVSRKVLEEAIKEPEKFSNLVVRVSGFSAYFIRLSPAEQKDILERTEHG